MNLLSYVLHMHILFQRRRKAMFIEQMYRQIDGLLIRVILNNSSNWLMTKYNELSPPTSPIYIGVRSTDGSIVDTRFYGMDKIIVEDHNNNNTRNTKLEMDQTPTKKVTYKMWVMGLANHRWIFHSMKISPKTIIRHPKWNIRIWNRMACDIISLYLSMNNNNVYNFIAMLQAISFIIELNNWTSLPDEYGKTLNQWRELCIRNKIKTNKWKHYRSKHIYWNWA